MFTTDAVILEGARTPMIRYMGAFDDTNALELGAVASKEAIRRAKVDPNEFDHVVFGNVMQTSADALYGARHVGLKAGLPIETPAVTVNRLCGSGMESITQAAQRILLGEAKMVLAGGMENMSQCPHVIRGARTGFRLGEGKLEDSLMSGLYDTYCGFSMSETAENLASEQGITRRASDEYALRSQQAADAAFRSCYLKAEIAPVERDLLAVRGAQAVSARHEHAADDGLRDRRGIDGDHALDRRKLIGQHAAVAIGADDGLVRDQEAHAGAREHRLGERA